MTSLYPEIEPISTHTYAASSLHTVHYEKCGNPSGKPVLFVHGGPGGGVDPFYRRLFNPDKYYMILVDQRGSGKSTPHAEIKENTTSDLINDFEAIRLECGIDKWMVFGGSWGSTLSLAYAQEHPSRVTELVLRGIFLATKDENEWLFGGKGANFIFPDYWEEFISIIPEDERANLLEAYYRRLMGDCKKTMLEAAHAWSKWEFCVSTLLPDVGATKDFLQSDTVVSLARLECHYMHHQCFLDNNQLLDNLSKISHIPGYIVHGRYDVVCAPHEAWRLHKRWPGSELVFVDAAGHSLKERALAEQLVCITDRLA